MAHTGALFQPSSQTSQNHNLVEFKAGKMTLQSNNWVHPDKRKGQAYIHQSDDGLMHFCWKDRTTGVVEDDLIVFPDETKYIPVTRCKTGRVYLLKFTNSKKYFLWMQEPREDKDEEICRKVNEYLNNPPTNTGRNRGGVPSSLGGLGPNDMQELLGHLNISQTELLNLLSMGMNSGRPSATDSESSTRIHSSAVETYPTAGASPGATTQATPTVTSSSAAGGRPISSTSTTGESPLVSEGGTGGKIQLSDLHNILASMSGGAGGGRDGASVDLADLVNMDSMRPLLANPDIQARLQPHLPAPPEGVTASPLEQDIETNIRSAQFRSAVKAFGGALQSGEIAAVIAQFNLGPKVNEAAQKGDIVMFAKALEEATKKESDKKPEDETEKMDET